jgi:hypothetical protein
LEATISVALPVDLSFDAEVSWSVWKEFELSRSCFCAHITD